jgi:predicted kinase
MKNKMYILVAPQCSGKSTWVRENIATMNNAYIASTDDVRTSLYPELSYDEAFVKVSDKEAKRIMREGMIDAIKNGRDIIVDRTNMKVRSRKEFLNSVGKDYEKIAIVFPWDKVTFIKRNEDRILKEGKSIPLSVWESMSKNYQTPTREEGFDKVIFLK